MTYFKGFGYLLLYNIILIIPLVAVLVIASNPILIDRVKEWRRTQMRDVHLWAGLAMVVIGLLVLFI